MRGQKHLAGVLAVSESSFALGSALRRGALQQGHAPHPFSAIHTTFPLRFRKESLNFIRFIFIEKQMLRMLSLFLGFLR
jgi:hypothetical protein